MNKKMIPIGVVCVLLAMAIGACNLPGSAPTSTPSEPTPNQTMTALFNIITPQPTLILPSGTPSTSHGIETVVPSVVPNTAVPTLVVNTATQAVAATTSVPTVVPVFPTSTATGAPSATPSARAAGNVNVPYLSSAPVLDGVWDEWKTTAYPAKFIVYGKDQWVGSEDLEGSYRIGWDATYLYLAVKVIDDKYVQNATGVDIFKGDSIELLLDANLRGDFYTQKLDSDDYQLQLSPGKPDPDDPKEAYLYYPSNVAGARTDVKIAAVGGDGLYRVEAAIPWSVFGISPASGQQYGFAVSISDNDHEDKNQQDTMASNDAGRHLTDPTTWVMMTLTR